MTWSLADISEKMRHIDFAMLMTHAPDGALSGRPMSNNGEVEYSGDSFFFADDSATMIEDIRRDPHVALSYAGSKGLLGKPPLFISIAGAAELIKDTAAFAEHWTKDLERWWPQGVETPGLTLIKVRAERIHYWDGDEDGEIVVL